MRYYSLIYFFSLLKRESRGYITTLNKKNWAPGLGLPLGDIYTLFSASCCMGTWKIWKELSGICMQYVRVVWQSMEFEFLCSIIHRWSTEFGASESGSPEIHDMLAEYIYSQSPEMVGLYIYIGDNIYFTLNYFHWRWI